MLSCSPLSRYDSDSKLPWVRSRRKYWIESGQLDRDLDAGRTRYSPRPAVASTLAPYKEMIKARLQEFPKVSAQLCAVSSSAALLLLQRRPTTGAASTRTTPGALRPIRQRSRSARHG